MTVNITTPEIQTMLSKLCTLWHYAPLPYQSPEVKFRLACFGFKSCIFLAVCKEIWQVKLKVYNISAYLVH